MQQAALPPPQSAPTRPLEVRSTSELLAGGRLPRWAVPAAAGGSIAVALLLFVSGINPGVAQSVIVAVLLFVVVQTLWSFVVEGRRHAADRLMTTVVYATCVAAVVPLIEILGTVIVKGVASLNAEFLTNSMRNVSPRAPGGGLAHAIVGTIEQVLAATVIAVPIGVLVAVYLVEYGSG
ncbi:MAG: phosphate ABC transporter, permease protein PstA, partial [Actinomycetes bacterium]